MCAGCDYGFFDFDEPQTAVKVFLRGKKWLEFAHKLMPHLKKDSEDYATIKIHIDGEDSFVIAVIYSKRHYPSYKKHRATHKPGMNAKFKGVEVVQRILEEALNWEG